MILNPNWNHLSIEAVDVAGSWGLDPILVCCVCENESLWWPNAIRWEKGFYKHYTEPMNLPESDEMQRACSYGLMQIMGEVAREAGYTLPFSGLYDPTTNVYWGCLKLRKCLEHTGNDVTKALLMYNGGGNPAYPKLVLDRAWRYQANVATGAVDLTTRMARGSVA